ncbi:MAG TPA: DUF1549 domain-containing protein [Planctomycetaceae bacterium]|jgi:hypothetical protein|nr:DUF1549 domain-containing protein [Planctomycetaceae bacterium]
MPLLLAHRWLLAWTFCCSASLFAAEPSRRLTSRELAERIDLEFNTVWRASQIEPPAITDDATFLRRAFLDLSGTIPPVSQVREFLDYTGEHKRFLLIERLLTENRRPERYAERTAAHWASLWRRMMIPGNTPEAQQAVMLEPWLKTQFAENVPYNDIVRKLITAKTSDSTSVTAANPRLGVMASGPAMYLQVAGGKPETSASAVSRMFLGVRIGCAECHNHPFAEWKQSDFWGMAAFFIGVKNGSIEDSSTLTIRPENSTVDYTATFLASGQPAKLAKGKMGRETVADWIVAPENTLFAATAVNRVWLHLLGRGLTESVDDLDKASPQERKFLDELARHFVAAGYDLRWLISGICQSQLYQREAAGESLLGGVPGLRPVKTLTPEQLFNSLEQALALPVARADGSARFNGLRDQLISRMNEAAGAQPEEYRAGVPQALLLMNGQLTTEATDLERSRTLRGVLDAPFLDTEQKLTTLFYAAFSRKPRDDEREFLLEHVRKSKEIDKQNQACAEIFWGLLNSPEFVLER